MREIAIVVGLAIVVSCWTSAVILQLSTPPLFADALIDPIWQQTSRLLRDQVPPSVSLVLNQPYFAAGAQIACVLSLACGLFLGQSRTTAHTILNVFAASGLAYASFGLGAHTRKQHWPAFRPSRVSEIHRSASFFRAIASHRYVLMCVFGRVGRLVNDVVTCGRNIFPCDVGGRARNVLQVHHHCEFSQPPDQLCRPARRLLGNV
jgi:hypothetical protein